MDDIEITDPTSTIMTYISKNESIPSCKEEKDECVITKLNYKPDVKDRGKIIGCEVVSFRSEWIKDWWSKLDVP